MALTTNSDIIPIYMFGNTSCLTVFKSGPLAQISRKLGVSITYFRGWNGTPIPRPCKLVYVRGKCLGLPHIESPSQEDIDKYHELYCKEVRRLFESYKKGVPGYEDKELFID